MKFLLVVFLEVVALVASKSLSNDSVVDLECYTVYGYLSRVGQPLANRIRKAEAEANLISKIHKSAGVSSRIVKGFPCQPGDIPYQAGLLSHFTAGQSVCGGSLLNSRRVLTAAHCWWDGVHRSHTMTVVLGSVTLFSGGTRLQTSNVVMHSEWNPRMISNDIAMVYMPTAVQFSSTIRPIALPSGRQLNENFVGETVIASGFGLTRDDDEISPATYLSYVKLRVISNMQCRRFFAIVRPSNLCTSGDSRENIGSGDSGGPLAVTRNNKRVLIGVVSFGSDTSCENGLPGGFTRVTSFIDWIQAHLH